MKSNKHLLVALMCLCAVIRSNAIPSPVVNNEAYAVASNSVLSVSAPGILTNDTDPNGYPLQSFVAVNPSHGSLALASNGSLVYTPQLNYSGFDNFSYKVNNGFADSGLATDTLIVGRLTTNTYNFTYSDKAGLTGDGWSYLAKTSGGSSRNTETTTGAVVSFDQTAHPGAMRIPVDVGDLSGNANNTRNSIFRTLPDNWISIRLAMTFKPTAHSQQAHLALYQDDDDYVEIGHAYDTNQNGENIEMIAGDNNYSGLFVSPFGLVMSKASINASNIHLRIDRDLSCEKVIGYYSTNGTSWRLLGSISQILASPKICIWAGGSASGLPNCDLQDLEVITSSVPVTPELLAQPKSLVFHTIAGQPCTNFQQLRATSPRTIGLMGWSLSKTSSWVTVSSTDNMAPGFCDVSVNASGLSAGVYESTLTLDSPGNARPTTAKVTLIVNPAVRVQVTPWKNGKRAAMSVSIDDSFPTAFDDLSTNGVQGTYMLWDVATIPTNFTTYYNAGMELGGHSVNHFSFQPDLPTQRYEMATNFMYIAALTAQPPEFLISYAWPWGVSSPLQKVIGSDYLLSARGYHVNLLEDPTPYDFMYLKSYNSHEYNAQASVPSAPANLSDLRTGVDLAIAQGKWYHLVLHSVNDSDGAIHYSVGKDIWFGTQGAVVKYILQRDSTVITNYFETNNAIQFDMWRLSAYASPLRSFETAFTAQDVLTFQMDTTGLPRVFGVFVNGSPVAYSTNQNLLTFNTLVTRSSQHVLVAITKPLLTVTANNQTRAYGQANPTFTGTLSANADSITASFGSIATLASNVGTYPIFPILSDPNTKLTNYTIITNFGTLTITQALLTVIASAANKTYDRTVAATATLSDNRMAGDSFTSSYTNAFFASRNAGNGQTVTVQGVAITGGASANYLLNATTLTTTASITPKSLIVSATGINKVYDATPAATATLSDNRISGDVFTVNITSAAFADKNAGLSKQMTVSGISLSGADSGNYLPNTSALTTADITKAPLILAADPKSRSYGTTNPLLTGTYSGFVSPQDTNRLTGTLVLNTTAKTNSPIGNYAITASGVTSTNYTVSFANGTLTVTPAALSVTPKNASRKYGDVNPPFTGTITGIQNNENVAGTYGTPATPASGVGTYAITVSSITTDVSLTNYIITTNAGTLSITQANLTVSASAASKVYDGTAAAAVTLSDNRVNNDTLTTSYASASFADKNAGSGKQVTVSGISVSGANSANYLANSSTTTSADITPAPLVLTADTKSRLYGATNPVLSATYTGFVLPQDASGVSGTLALNTAAKTNSPIGNYAITPSGVSYTNYGLIFSNGTLTVTPAALRVTPTNLSRSYGLANPLLTGIVLGIQNGDSISASYNTAATPTSSVGAYAILPSLINSDGSLTNYSVTTNIGILTITQASLTVTASAANKVYDGNTTASVILSDSRFNNDHLTVGYANAAFADKNAGFGKQVNVDGISVGGADSGNYTANVSATTSANITPATLGITANNFSRGYGETNPIFTFSYSGFISNENPGVLAGALTSSTSAQTNSPVGLYDIVPLGLTSLNYAIYYTNGVLNVIPANLLIVAESTNRAYGLTNPPFTAGFFGWANGDDTNVLGGFLDFTTLATTNSPVGVYDIVPQGIYSTNYSLTYSNGSLSITPNSLAVVADNQSRFYGTANPPLTGSLMGGQNGDNITPLYGTTADISSGVGNYVISASLLDPNLRLTNYSTTLSNGTLTIKPVPLTITAEDKSRLYGQTNPLFTAYYSGFVQGEGGSILGGSLSGSTTAQTNSPPGTYPIKMSGLQASNYTLSYVDGALVISPAELIIKALDASRPYGQTNPTFQADISGWVNGEGTNLLDGALILDTIAETNSNTGTYAIVPRGFASGNYAIAFSNGTLTVTRANSKLLLQSQTNPSMQFSNVTFVASLSPIAPATTAPTGEILFLTNGSPLGASVSATDGVATATNLFSLAGTNNVSAVYLGNQNYMGSTNSLLQIVNLYLDPPRTLSIHKNNDGTVTITFSGTPTGTYYVEAALDLFPEPAWTDISTNVVGDFGEWFFTDSTTNNSQRYYRATKP